MLHIHSFIHPRFFLYCWLIRFPRIAARPFSFLRAAWWIRRSARATPPTGGRQSCWRRPGFCCSSCRGSYWKEKSAMQCRKQIKSTHTVRHKPKYPNPLTSDLWSIHRVYQIWNYLNKKAISWKIWERFYKWSLKKFEKYLTSDLLRNLRNTRQVISWEIWEILGNRYLKEICEILDKQYLEKLEEILEKRNL